MAGRFRLLYPLAFSVLPVLFFVERAPGVFVFREVVATSLLVLTACGLVYGLMFVLLRRRAAGETIAFIAWLGVLWFYGYADVYRRAARVVPDGPWHAVLIPGGVSLAVASTVWLARHPGVLRELTTFLGLTFGLLLAVDLTSIGVTMGRDWTAVRTSRLARELGRPLSVDPAARQAPRRARDVYLIILDEHADAPTVREMTGADIRPFVDSLRRLGFTVPRVVRNNYAHTTLSLPSLLNFSLLGALTAEAGRESRDPALADHLLQRNRAARYFQALGYEVVFVPSEWWPATRHMAGADRELAIWPHGGFPQWAARGLPRRIEPHTVFTLGRVGHPADTDYLRRTFTALGTLPSGATRRPRFVIAHVLSPHEPFVFDRACRDARTSPAPRDGYREQVACIDRLVLRLVTGLVAQASLPPIILLQGDHGSGFRGFAQEPSAAAVSPAQLRERFAPFGAYYLPDGGGEAVENGITLVNLLPIVLNEYFCAGLALQPDDVFVSVDREPFEFRHVELPGSESAGGKAAGEGKGISGREACGR